MTVAVCATCGERWDVPDIGGVILQRWLDIIGMAIWHWNAGHRVLATTRCAPKLESVLRQYYAPEVKKRKAAGPPPDSEERGLKKWRPSPEG